MGTTPAAHEEKGIWWFGLRISSQERRGKRQWPHAVLQSRSYKQSDPQKHPRWHPFVFSPPPRFILLQFKSRPDFRPSVHARFYLLCLRRALNMRLQHVIPGPVVALILQTHNIANIQDNINILIYFTLRQKEWRVTLHLKTSGSNISFSVVMVCYFPLHDARKPQSNKQYIFTGWSSRSFFESQQTRRRENPATIYLERHFPPQLKKEALRWRKTILILLYCWRSGGKQIKRSGKHEKHVREQLWENGRRNTL